MTTWHRLRRPLVALVSTATLLGAPATAEPSDPAASVVTGELPTDLEVVNSVALCAAPCVKGAVIVGEDLPPGSFLSTSTDGTLDGTFELSGLVSTGIFRIAVRHTSSGGTRTGYLMHNGSGGWDVTNSFDAADSFTVPPGEDLGRYPIASPAPSTSPTARVWFIDGRLFNEEYPSLWFRADRVEPGTRIVVRAYAFCRAERPYITKRRHKNGRFTVGGHAPDFNTRTWHYTIRITQPGKRAKFFASSRWCLAKHAS